MRSHAVALALLVSLAAPVAARAQRGQPAVTGFRVTAEAASGVVAMPIGFFGGGLATRWLAHRVGVTDDEKAGTIATIGAYSIAALATAVPPTLIGNAAPHTTGSYVAALGGSVVGGLGSWALVRLNQPAGRRDQPCRVLCVASTVAIFLLPSAGATLGYNLSRRYAGPVPPH
jgi:uncharacterized membrane protein